MNMKRILQCTATVFILFSGSLLYNFINPTDTTAFICQAGKRDMQQIDIALLFQRWDYMDVLLRIFILPFHYTRLAEIEHRFNVTCNLHILWDGRQGGAVQDGALEDLGIDVAIGPGGVGAWCTPDAYRDVLTRYIKNGGGFLGACGDAYLGTTGAINVPDDYEQLLWRLFRYENITSPLDLIDVSYDVGPMAKIFETPLTHNNLFVLLLLLSFFVSTADVTISDGTIPFAEYLHGETVKIMESGAPMVSNKSGNESAMSDFFIIGTFSDVQSLYDDSLMIGKYAIVASQYGQGRVVLSSVHPEVSIGLNTAHNIFGDMILWLSGFNH